MRAALILAFALALASGAGAATADPTEAWKPIHAFIGTWKGVRPAAQGAVKVTRTYASAPTNHHIEITEKGGDRSRAVWGVVSFDPQRQALVLRHFAADGAASDVAHDPAATTGDQLVFASADSEGARTRITYERAGWRNFVERIELASGSGPYTLVSETRFVRQD
jgi:hypothetical protein